MKIALLFGLIALLATPASAQQVAGFTCNQFSHNSDGSWSTVVPIQAQANSLGTGEKIISGVFVGGIDLGKQLDQHCAAQ